jgi:hypothetical protein
MNTFTHPALDVQKDKIELEAEVADMRHLL